MKTLVVFGCSTSIEYRWCLFPLNRSFTQPFGTHTFYQRGGGGGGQPDSPCYLKKRCDHEREILSGIKDIFELPRIVKVTYIVINWLP